MKIKMQKWLGLLVTLALPTLSCGQQECNFSPAHARDVVAWEQTP
jgi:hypothetical protein